MTPEQTIRAAAAKLREAATDATPGPWRSAETHLGQYGYTATVLTDRENLNDTELVAWLPSMSQTPWDEERKVWPTAAYIALMHPGIGLALADWLDGAAARERANEAAAARVYTTPADQAAWLDDHRDHQALAVARQILGDQP